MNTHSIKQNHINNKKPSVLLVEDAPVVQRIHQFYLEKMGCRVDIAPDGQQALEKIDNNYDLILMDIGLPVLNGIDLTNEIRQRELEQAQAHIPIVAVTIYPPEEVKPTCYEAGVNEVIFKPLTYEAFNQVISRWLNKE